MWKFCNQITLDFNVKFPGGFQYLWWITRLGNMLWVLEIWKQYKNFFGILVFRFVGHLLGGSMVDLRKQLYDGVNGDLLQQGLCHRLCDPGGCTQSPYPCSRPLLTHISHASKITLKILQVRLHQYVNCELTDVQAGFRKG